MKHKSSRELHHEIFGSVLDRTEMTPYLLLKTMDYEQALARASRIMANRGFDTAEGTDLDEGERKRAAGYIKQACRYCSDFLFPALKGHLRRLEDLHSPNQETYRKGLQAIAYIEDVLHDNMFIEIIFDDPRHLFLMASSRKYPHVFNGYRGSHLNIPFQWQQTACAILKTAFLIKSIEEDSQDVNDYAQLGLFFQMNGQGLYDLYNYDWHKPQYVPETEPAQRAYVKIATFFLKLKDSVNFDPRRECLVFNSGDGVDVDIVRIESRLKSPESMFTKLGKNIEGEAQDIRDILALTFILKSRDDTLMLFHALQKRGVILQENTLSQTITQTLFDRPEDMVEATRNLMISLAKSEGEEGIPSDEELRKYAQGFYNALNVNAAKNPHSAMGHRKFQCKLNVSIPIHRETETNKIIIPGTAAYSERNRIRKKTGQHTLALELRISDEDSWQASEQKGDSHHDAYKFRQLVSVMNRVFKDSIPLDDEGLARLKEDQKRLFP